MTANNKQWQISSTITCNSFNAIYYLVCLRCETETYYGKNNILRLRINQHISDSRTTDNTSNKFDRHVFLCKQRNNVVKEPLFQLYALVKLQHEYLLIPYDSHLHNMGADTMNR